jgi:hypothetical protein
VLLPAARRAYFAATESEQQEFETSIDYLCHEPLLDPPLKERSTFLPW